MTKLTKFLKCDGIGDTMDTLNLRIAAGFTMLVFAFLWTCRLTNVAMGETVCAPGSNLFHPELNKAALQHCTTAKRYFVDESRGEQIKLDLGWRASRKRVLWFWVPIVLTMFVMTRCIWTGLVGDRGINFPNVEEAAKSVSEHDQKNNLRVINKEKLRARLAIVKENLRAAARSKHLLSAFIVFEFVLVLAPIFLLVVALPFMIGSDYRSWGFDVAGAMLNGEKWQGNALTSSKLPLFPIVTLCDYHTLLGTYTYRCHQPDTDWLEWIALFIWTMLATLTILNILNFLSWCRWAMLMNGPKYRKDWVLHKWLRGRKEMAKFAGEFSTGEVLLLYYIEAHTSRDVAKEFCLALFEQWEKEKKLATKDEGKAERKETARSNNFGSNYFTYTYYSIFRY